MNLRDHPGGSRVLRLWLAAISLSLPGAPPPAIIIRPGTSVVVNEGGILQFSADIPVKWSLAPGSPGSITASGTYYAPVSVTPQQSIGGCQLLPNSHVYNTRIDSLPVHPMSDAWMAGLGGGPRYEPSGFPVNYLEPTERITPASFYYTPENNGPFTFPVFPNFDFESGYFTWDAAQHDRHSIILDPADCGIEEIYNYYPAGFNAACPTCISQSGIKYPMMGTALPGSAGQWASTDAAGLQLLPLIFRMAEVQAGAIQHALRFTLQAPDATWLWPAQTSSGHTAGKMPMGARVRLKASFDINTLQSPIAKILAVQLQQYGIILSDIGTNFDIQSMQEPTPDAFVSGAGELGSRVTAPMMEVVDESSLTVTNGSGDTQAGTTVIATSLANPAETATARVYLAGVTVGVLTAYETIQAGSAPKQLTAWVHGATDTSVTWRMSPSLGSLSATGVYTPPAFAPVPTTTTLTAQSNADSTASAQIVVTVMPPGVIRINAGDTVDYVDSQGQTWWADDMPGRPMAVSQSIPGDTALTSWQGTADPALFRYRRYSWSDVVYRMTVPNGAYKITLEFGDDTTAAGQRLMNIDTQGQVLYQNFDVYAAVGSDTAINTNMRATVTDGNLYVGVRERGGLPTQLYSCCTIPLYSPGGYVPFVSALSIAPVQQPVITWAAPADIVSGTALGPLQLDAAANVPGTFQYSPPAGTILPPGNGQVLRATFTPSDTIGYNSASATVLINVQPSAANSITRRRNGAR